MASRALPVRHIMLLASLAFALALSASLACVPSAHAATKADVVAKVETLGLPQHLMGIGYGVAKAVDFDAATGDAIMGDIDRAVALLAGRSVYDLGVKDSAALIELCAASLARVGVLTEYAFNPAGGADITLSKDGAVIAKFNTRDSGVVRTGGEALPWGALAGAALGLALAAACAVAFRRGRRTTVAALSCMLAVPLALATVPAFADPAPADGTASVTSVVLTLTEPVAGEQASDVLSADPQMAEAGLAWEHGGQPFTGAFVEGEEYTARISLTSDAPFSGNVSVTVNGRSVRPMFEPDYLYALQCSISFTAKAASSEPIDGEFEVVLDRPLPNESPSARADVTVDGKADGRVSAKVSWTDERGGSEGPTGSVGEGYSYTATVTLETAEGFCFGEGSVVLAFLDAVMSETIVADSEKGSRELVRVFSYLVGSPIEGEMKVFIERPRTGEPLPGSGKVTLDGFPDKRVDCGVTWSDKNGTWLGSGHLAEQDATYTCEVSVTPREQYYFSAGMQSDFNEYDDGGASIFEQTYFFEDDMGVVPVKKIATSGPLLFATYEVILCTFECKPEAEIPEWTGTGCTVVSLFGDDALETEALRSFRDGALSQSSLGQGLTLLYYEVAPYVTAFLNDVPALKPAARAVVGWAAQAVT